MDYMETKWHDIDETNESTMKSKSNWKKNNLKLMTVKTQPYKINEIQQKQFSERSS